MSSRPEGGALAAPPARTTFTPFCISSAKDRDAFARLHAIFDTDDAKRFGLRAIAQRYTVAQGWVTADGAPIFLHDDPSTGALLTCTDLFELKNKKALAFQAGEKGMPSSLVTDMIHITSHQAWLLVFPRLLLMQAENVLVEIGAVRVLRSDIEQSAWARGAYATICVAAPQSNHEKLVVMNAIPDALQTLRTFRSGVFRAIEAKGYDLGPFSLDDLEFAIKMG